MEPSPGPSAQTPVSGKRGLRPPLRITLALGVLLIAAILLLTLVIASNPKVVWLKPSELNRPAHSTLYTRFKFKVAGLVWPLIHRYWHAGPSIRTDVNVLTLSTAAMEQIDLGAPFATNLDGLRIWVLSPVELVSFGQRLKIVPGASSLGKLTTQTANGRQAQVSTGGPINLTADITPKLGSGSIKLTIGVTATELITSLPGKPAVLRTNLAVACQVLVPNGGGFVIDGGSRKAADGKSWWVITSPVAVDALGNPIKP